MRLTYLSGRAGKENAHVRRVQGQTVVWITGATSGLGAGLASTVPFPAARIVNIARRPRPGLENLIADLSDPGQWPVVRDHLHHDLRAFEGCRALIVHNAAVVHEVGDAGTLDPAAHDRQAILNAAAPLVLGEAFLAACPPNLDAGLVMISSSAASEIYPNRASYSAGKASLEQWIKVVHAERAATRSGPWVLAVRPGTVDSPAVRSGAAADPAVFPAAAGLRRAYELGLVQSPEEVGRAIWRLVPRAYNDAPIERVGPTAASIKNSSPAPS
jgi:short-subunit dehydrogenase